MKNWIGTFGNLGHPWGVPGLAWTPDSKQLVFWAGGKIHRVQRDGSNLTTIPFRVESSRSISPALRFPVEVHPETVSVRNPRWVQVSPDGEQILFQALGKIYIQERSSGTVRRVTDHDRGFEFYPAWSFDGSRIVYTTWDDSRLGSVRVHTIRSGSDIAVTTEPGHYVEPVFSPDGDTIVFRKASGGGIVDPRWSNETGLYRITLSGQQPEFLIREGRNPHFGNEAGSLFFTHRGAEGPQLEELDLTTRNRVVRAQSKFATRMRVSPDGNTLAFSENYRAYSIPFPRTGKPIPIGPKMKELPLRSVSSRSGRDLHFSGDGTSILWSEGPVLWSAPKAQSAKAQKDHDD